MNLTPMQCIISHMKAHKTKAEIRKARQAAVKARWEKSPWKSLIPEQQLRAMYLDQGMSQREIAATVGVTIRAVQTAMRNFKIPPRKPVHKKTGQKSWHWKGAKAGYQAKHLRVQKLRGKPQKCELCGTTDKSLIYHWANLTGDYDNPSDYKRMCPTCHRRYDNKRRSDAKRNQKP